MFRFSLSEIKVWRSVIDAISEIIDEANFVATPNGLSLRAMDPSHVAMVEVELPKSFFDEYNCEGNINIGVNLDEFRKILKRGSAKDKMSLEVTSDRKLKITFSNKAERNFSIPLLDIAGEEIASPSLEFNVHSRLASEVFEDAIKDASLISDYVKISAEGDVLKISASGERGDVEVKLSEASGSLIELNVKEPSSSTYSLNYLEDLVKASSASEILVLEFSTDMPLKLSFELPNEGRITYYLAPRVE
ncbi:MAG: proliferating cell nuclear antigen (pcna) [archaeon YNP-WB-040]|jgi:proliferating cell nuclear antigen|nr:proliferating cell nuclear antigen (pcna) [Candidatus Culexarchaeum yellowstonense]